MYTTEPYIIQMHSSTYAAIIHQPSHTSLYDNADLFFSFHPPYCFTPPTTCNERWSPSHMLRGATLLAPQHPSYAQQLLCHVNRLQPRHDGSAARYFGWWRNDGNHTPPTHSTHTQHQLHPY